MALQSKKEFSVYKRAEQSEKGFETGTLPRFWLVRVTQVLELREPISQ